MSLAVSNQSHSILKSHKDFASASGKPLRVVSFETIDVAPISEKYRNDLINNSRQRDINAYHKMSNPYYLAPSFNKPFLNHDFKTPKYTRVPNANTFLVLVRLNLADNHLHPHLHVHAHGHGHDPGNEQDNVIDELSLLSLKYTVSQLAKSNDQIYVLSVINKFDLKYHEKGYYLTGTEIQKYKNLLDTKIVPLLQSAIMSSPQQQQQDNQKEFLLSMNLLFDQNVSLSIENTILDFSPNVVILSHNEKSLDSDQENGSGSGGSSGTRGRTARLLLLKIANHSPITNYCMKKLSCPIVVYTSNNAVRHYRVEDEGLISSLTSDKQLAGSTATDLSENGTKATNTTTTNSASSSSGSINANSNGSVNDSKNDNSGPSIKEDFFINLIKSVPIAGASLPSSRSSSQSRSQSRSISRSMSRSVSRSRSRQRNANATTSPTSPTYNSRSDSRSSSLLHKHRSLSPLASMSSLRPSRSAQQQRLSPYKSNESLSGSLSKNFNGHSNANVNSNTGFSGLTPYRSADTALLQASRKRATAEKDSFGNGSSGRENGIFGGRRISSVAEENPVVDDIREKLKKRVSTFSKFKQKLSSSASSLSR